MHSNIIAINTANSHQILFILLNLQYFDSTKTEVTNMGTKPLGKPENLGYHNWSGGKEWEKVNII